MLRFAQSKLVHASTGTATRRQNCNSSYTPSTRRRGMSCRQNILSRIKVAVVDRTACETSPRSVFKLERLIDRSALATFAGRFESVTKTKFASVPSTLVLKHAPEFSKPCIANSSSQISIFKHAAHVEILEGDRAEPANQVGRDFIEVILARVSYLNVQPGD